MKKYTARVDDGTTKTDSWRRDWKAFHSVKHSRGNTAGLARITVLYYHCKINSRLKILVTDNQCWNSVILSFIASV
jgi:hypothetical protein